MNSDLSDVDDIRLVPRACYLENGSELHKSFARSWWIASRAIHFGIPWVRLSLQVR